MTLHSLRLPLKFQPNVYVIIIFILCPMVQNNNYYYYIIIIGLRSSIKDALARMGSVVRRTTDNSGEGEGKAYQYMRSADVPQFCSFSEDFNSYRQYILLPNY